MADATQYNPQVAFRIKVSKVYQLTAEGANPATYRLSYTVEGINDLGAMATPLTTYYLIDYIGVPFTILTVSSGTLDVEDSFRTKECPVSNENGLIYKSVGDGTAPFLSPSSLQFLHPLAIFNINKWNLDILWDSKQNKNIGIYVMPTLTKNGDGTVTVGTDGIITFNTIIDGSGASMKLNCTVGNTLTPTNNAVSYIYADYNNGSPIYAITSNSIQFFTNAKYVPIVRVTRIDSTILHFEEYGEYGILLSNKQLFKDIALNGSQRQLGLALSTAATRISTVSSGISWFAVKYYNLAENKSGTSGTMYEYYLVSGVWNKSLVTAYDSSYYSDGTDRQSLLPNKWVSKYFFRDNGDDNEVYYVHGDSYAKEIDCYNEIIPSVTTSITSHSIYVGKIVIQQGSTNGIAYPRIWGNEIIMQGAVNHFDLTLASLVWDASGHTGTSNRIAAFGNSGQTVFTVPATINSITENIVSEINHTHELGKISNESIGNPLIEYGFLYNWPTTQLNLTSSSDYSVPTNAQFGTLVTYLGGQTVAGGKLKETGFTHWLEANVGATNEVNFNGRGGGERSYSDGTFSGIKEFSQFWMSDALDATHGYMRYLSAADTIVNPSSDIFSAGYAIRIFRAATTPELSFPDGLIAATYTGNDGKIYPLTKIGTQIWLACNLAETQLRDHTPLTYVSDNTIWSGLTTEGYCAYNKNLALVGGETPLVDILTGLQDHANLSHLAWTSSGHTGTASKLAGFGSGGEAVYVDPYSLPTATDTVLGGVKIGSRLEIASGVVNTTIVTEDIAFEFADVVAGTAKDYTLDIKASFGYTIESACLETNNGTLTGVAVKINSTAVTSLSSLTVDTAVDETASTGAKTVVANDRVWLSISTGYTGTPTLIRGKLKIKRT